MKQLSTSVKTSAMKSSQYDDVYDLWSRSAGVRLTSSDSKEQISRYLKRNKNLSSVALIDGKIVGAILCGHDGLKGFIHHLAVDSQHRRVGVAQALVQRSLSHLAEQGIGVCQIVVSSANCASEEFWRELGWRKQDDYLLLSDQPQEYLRSVWEYDLPQTFAIAA